MLSFLHVALSLSIRFIDSSESLCCCWMWILFQVEIKRHCTPQIKSKSKIEKAILLYCNNFFLYQVLYYSSPFLFFFFFIIISLCLLSLIYVCDVHSQSIRYFETWHVVDMFVTCHLSSCHLHIFSLMLLLCVLYASPRMLRDTRNRESYFSHHLLASSASSSFFMRNFSSFFFLFSLFFFSLSSLLLAIF